jgi:hypothetical protein
LYIDKGYRLYNISVFIYKGCWIGIIFRLCVGMIIYFSSQWIALLKVLHSFYRECQWHYREDMPPLSWNRLLLQGRVHLDLEFYWVYLWYASCDWWRVRFLVVPFPPCGLPLLGCLLAWTLVLAPCFFFSHFLGCLLFMKFDFLVLMCFLSYLSELATQCVMAIYR